MLLTNETSGRCTGGANRKVATGSICFPIGWRVVVKETAVRGRGSLVGRGFRDAEALRQLTHRHLGRHLRTALSSEARGL